MTETTYDVQVLEAIYEVLPNEVLQQVLRDAMEIAGPPDFSQEDLGFARQLEPTFPRTLEEVIIDEKLQKARRQNSRARF